MRNRVFQAKYRSGDGQSGTVMDESYYGFVQKTE